MESTIPKCRSDCNIFFAFKDLLTETDWEESQKVKLKIAMNESGQAKQKQNNVTVMHAAKSKKHAPTYMTGADKHKQELHSGDQITTWVRLSTAMVKRNTAAVALVT